MQAKTDLDRSFKGPGIDCLVDAIVWRPGVGSVSSAVTSTLFGDLSLQGGRAFILHRVYLNIDVPRPKCQTRDGQVIIGSP